MEISEQVVIPADSDRTCRLVIDRSMSGSGLTLTEDDTPPAPLGATYAGEDQFMRPTAPSRWGDHPTPWVWVAPWGIGVRAVVSRGGSDSSV